MTRANPHAHGDQELEWFKEVIIFLVRRNVTVCMDLYQHLDID